MTGEEQGRGEQERGDSAEPGPGRWSEEGFGTPPASQPTFEPGPLFHPPPLPPATSLPGRHPAPVPTLPPPQRRSRWPAAVTAVVVSVVTAVVVGATAVAHYADTHVAAPVRPPGAPAPRSSVASGAENGIDFTTERGNGRLVLVEHSWQRNASPASESGSTLRITVELLCTSGQVDYRPDYFAIFDADGRLFEAAADDEDAEALTMGTLEPGEQVSGVVTFDLPRGRATLVMNDDFSSVTAIQVPD